MEILFVVNDISFYGGLEKIVLKISDFLIKQDFKITILSLYKNKKIFYEYNEKINLDYLDIKANLNNNTFINRKIYENNLKKELKISIRKYLSEKHMDVVIGTFHQINEIIANLDNSNLKKIAWEHAHYYGYIDPEKHYSSLIGKLKKLYHENYYFKKRIKNYSKLDKVIVLTNRDLEKWSLNLKNVICIHNALTIEDINEFKYNEDSKKIISIGRLEEEKGFFYLIKAFEKIRKHHSDWKLEIIGSGSLYNQILELIKNKNLSEIIEVKKATTKISEEYKNASIFISTSIFEGFGLTIIEAMRMGLPIIAFDCYASPKELLQNGKIGLICKNRDINQLSEYILYLIENINIRKKLSNNSKEESKKYDIKIIGEKWKKMLESL